MTAPFGTDVSLKLHHQLRREDLIEDNLFSELEARRRTWQCIAQARGVN